MMKKLSPKIKDVLNLYQMMILVGKSNCGKTNTFMNMLLRLLYCDKIYLYTNNAHQSKYQKLKEFMDEISHKIGYPVL